MWSVEDVLKLIDLYRTYDSLWDSTKDGYKNRAKKSEMWDELGLKMGMTRREVEVKIHGLRSQFNRERKRIKRAEKQGVMLESAWFAYKRLSFLIKLENGLDVAESDFAMNNDLIQDSYSNDSEFETSQDIEIKNEELNNRPKVTNITPTITRKRRNVDELSPPRRYVSDLDEFDIYGQYVASELRNVRSEHAVLMAKYHINNIILDARIGKLDKLRNVVSNVKSDSKAGTVESPMSRITSSRSSTIEVNNDSNTDAEVFVKIECEHEEN